MGDSSGEFQVVALPDAHDEDRRFAAVIAARYAVVDVQLTSDALANDAAFTVHYGDELGPGHYRYRSLHDRLGPERTARVRRFVSALLLRLTRPEDRFVWFVDGGLDEDGDAHDEDRLVLSGCVDRARINGAFAFYGGNRDALAYETQRLGLYDRVRALAGPGIALAHVLPALTLASPLPTTASRLQVGLSRFSALHAVLPLGRVFFEELANGTRLRLVSTKWSSAELGAAVDETRHELA